MGLDLRGLFAVFPTITLSPSKSTTMVIRLLWLGTITGLHAHRRRRSPNRSSMSIPYTRLRPSLTSGAPLAKRFPRRHDRAGRRESPVLDGCSSPARPYYRNRSRSGVSLFAVRMLSRFSLDPAGAPFASNRRPISKKLVRRS